MWTILKKGIKCVNATQLLPIYINRCSYIMKVDEALGYKKLIKNWIDYKWGQFQNCLLLHTMGGQLIIHKLTTTCIIESESNREATSDDTLHYNSRVIVSTSLCITSWCCNDCKY